MNLSVWVTFGSQNPSFGNLPVGAYVYDVDIHVTQAFNSDGTDNISVGYTGTTNAFATNTDVSTTGVKSVTLGSSIGYQSVSHEILAYYTNGGTEPTTGKALVILYYVLTPRSP